MTTLSEYQNGGHCGVAPSQSTKMDTRPILFFDVDDCLYPKSLGMEKLVNELVDQFLMKHLSLSAEEAAQLNSQYFRDHSLTVIGLHKLHAIDPLLFNGEVDDALPLNEMLSPNQDLRTMLARFDRTKVKLWLFTNAYVTHALRVVKLLGIEHFFEGITFCDYKTGLWPSKPHPEMFAKAEREAGASSSDQCFFVDDSPRNCKAASARGWQVVQIVDPKVSHAPDVETSAYAKISDLASLLDVFPQLSS